MPGIFRDFVGSLLLSLNQSFPYRPIPLPDIDGFIFIPPLDILYIQAIRNGCRVYFLDTKEPRTIPYSMDEMMGMVPGEKFCRVHRSFIVCIQHLKRTNKQNTRIIYSKDMFVPVSETYHRQFLQKAGFLNKSTGKINDDPGELNCDTR